MKKIFLVFIVALLLTSTSFVSAKEIKNSNNKIDFKPYTKQLNNRKLSSDIFESKSIKIIRNKYELQRQASEFAEGYEYLVTNKTTTPIVLQEMGASSIFNRSEISDRVNEIRPVDFIPVYSYYAWFKSIGEYRKFTKPFPFNNSIESNETVRILLLGRKTITPAVKFNFIVDNLTETLIVDSQNNRFQDYTEKDFYKSQIRSYNVKPDAQGLIKCINKNKTNLVEAFSKSEIDIDKKINGQPPAVYALMQNRPEVLELILKEGADPNATYLGKPVLYWAIIKNRPAIVKLLIDYGAKIDEKAIKYIQKSKNECVKNLILSKSK